MKGTKFLLGACFLALVNFTFANQIVNLDDAYKKTQCFSGNEDQSFNISTINHKKGKLRIKWGVNNTSSTGMISIDYLSNTNGTDVTSLDGKIEISLSQDEVLDDIYITYNAELNPDEISIVCFDYLEEYGKELKVNEKDTEQNSYNIFREDEMTFFLRTPKTYELLIPLFKVNESLSYKIEVKISNGTDLETFKYGGEIDSQLQNINVYYESNFNLTIIKLTIQEEHQSFLEANTYTMLRTSPISLFEEVSKKIEIDTSTIKDVPQVYYYPIYKIKGEKQIVYTTNMKDTNAYTPYEWVNNQLSSHSELKSLKVLDDAYVEDVGFNGDLISTILFYGDIVDKTKKYFVQYNVYTYQELKYYKNLITRNFVESNEDYSKVKYKIYEAYNIQSIAYFYKMNNLIGNSKFLYNEGIFDGKNELKEEFKESNNDYYLTNGNENELYFMTEKENDDSQFIIVPYYNQTNEYKFNLRYNDKNLNPYFENFIGLYLVNGTKVRLNEDYDFKILFKLPNNLPSNISDSIILNVYDEINDNSTNYTINKDNTILRIDCQNSHDYKFDFMSDKKILIEIYGIQKTYFERIKVKNVSDEDVVDDISCYNSYDYNSYVHRLNKTNTKYKYIKIDLKYTTNPEEVYIWKFYGDCNYPSVNNTMEEVKRIGSQNTTLTFINDYYINNKDNKNIYSNEDICLAVVVKEKGIYITYSLYYEGDEGEVSSEPQPAQSSGLQGWEVALIVIGVILAIAIIIFAVYYFVFRKKKFEEISPTELNSIQNNEGLVE